jgi:hypothetical protein
MTNRPPLWQLWEIAQELGVPHRHLVSLIATDKAGPRPVLTPTQEKRFYNKNAVIKWFRSKQA